MEEHYVYKIRLKDTGHYVNEDEVTLDYKTHKNKIWLTYAEAERALINYKQNKNNLELVTFTLKEVIYK